MCRRIQSSIDASANEHDHSIQPGALALPPSEPRCTVISDNERHQLASGIITLAINTMSASGQDPEVYRNTTPLHDGVGIDGSEGGRAQHKAARWRG